MSALHSYRVHWSGYAVGGESKSGSIVVRAFTAADAETQGLKDVRAGALMNWMGVFKIEPLEDEEPKS